MAPVIGITTYVEPARWGAWDQPAALLPLDYVTKVQAAGAHVVLLPPEGGPDEVVARLDGVLLSGGADLDAALYGQGPHPTADRPRTERDAHELAVYRAARDRGLPVLGICRGLQVMALAHGGSLTQHLGDVVDGERHRPAPGTYGRHGASLEPGSLVAKLLDATEVEVNSSHHQAVEDPGTLVVTGRADDGTIEVCEDPAASFVVGVQWHPEALEDPRIFQGLVDAAGR